MQLIDIHVILILFFYLLYLKIFYTLIYQYSLFT